MLFLLQYQDPAVTNVLKCLHNTVDSLSDTYTAAQMAYALALAGSNRLNDVMTTLESLATNQGKRTSENVMQRIILITLLNSNRETFVSVNEKLDP